MLITLITNRAHRALNMRSKNETCRYCWCRSNSQDV